MPRVEPVEPVLRRLQVEVTGACNLRCQMCLVRYRPPLDRRTASFPTERFVELLDELPDLEQVTLQGLGEPLLHPGLVDMVRAAKARGLRVGFNTNGTILTEDKANALLDAGVDWLHVSVDGATAETFERIRDGARFDKVIRNLRRLVELRRRRGVGIPTIQLNAVLMRSNLHELPDLVRLAADIGVDRLWLQALSHDFSDTADSPDAEAYVDIRRFAESEAVWADEAGSPAEAEALAEAARLARELDLDFRFPDDGSPPEPESPELPCDWPWDGAYVTHQGKVQPCCMVMGEDRAVLGDLTHDSFDTIWKGPEYESFRAQLLSDQPPAICRGCSWYRRVF